MGITPSGPFDVADEVAMEMLSRPNPNGLPSSDVLRPWINGEEITERWCGNWIIDFTAFATEEGASGYPRIVPKDAECTAKLKKRTLTNLYNERPAWLDLAHKKLDATVAAAYGFPADLTDEQILERLLALNLEWAAEEEKAAKTKKPKTSRGKKEDEMI